MPKSNQDITGKKKEKERPISFIRILAKILTKNVTETDSAIHKKG